MSPKNVYLESYGCPSNKFDLEVMITYLERSKYFIVKSPESADFLIINTCGVKKPTEDKILYRLGFLKGLGKPIIVAGCLTKISKFAIEKVIPNYLALLCPFSIDKIVTAIEGFEQGKRNQCFFSSKNIVKIEAPILNREKVVDIVPIAEGCLGSCTFCCTRFARRRLFSYPQETILNRIKKIVQCGIQEVWLTAQDTGAYGLDVSSDLATLLEAIINLSGNFFIRVGMMNPYNILGILERLNKTFSSGKIFKFLHLPVQSGNDAVLEQMSRSYKICDFKNIVNFFRRNISDITISTDIICGFPGENEDAFKDSLELIREIEPDIVNVSKYAHRPHTIAANMKSLPSEIVKTRSRKMAKLCRAISLKKNRRWLNWSGEVLIDEKGKGFSMVGRNFAYKAIVVEGGHDLLGRIVNVKINKVASTYLIGELISD